MICSTAILRMFVLLIELVFASLVYCEFYHLINLGIKILPIISNSKHRQASAGIGIVEQAHAIAISYGAQFLGKMVAFRAADTKQVNQHQKQHRNRRIVGMRSYS